MFKQLSWIVSLRRTDNRPRRRDRRRDERAAGVRLAQGTQTVVDEAAGTSEMHGSLIGTLADHEVRAALRVRLAIRRDRQGAVRRLSRLEWERRLRQARSRRHAEVHVHVLGLVRPATGALLHGNCVHPDHGRQRAASKAAGVIFMEDTPTVNAEVVTTYTGTLEYQAAKSGQAWAATGPWPRRATASPGHGGGCGAAWAPRGERERSGPAAGRPLRRSSPR